MTTNDIVINKLTQILSYLRQGRRDAKKLKKKEKGKLLSVKDLDKVPKAPEERYVKTRIYIMDLVGRLKCFRVINMFTWFGSFIQHF